MGAELDRNSPHSQDGSRSTDERGVMWGWCRQHDLGRWGSNPGRLEWQGLIRAGEGDINPIQAGSSQCRPSPRARGLVGPVQAQSWNLCCLYRGAYTATRELASWVAMGQTWQLLDITPGYRASWSLQQVIVVPIREVINP